MRIALITEDLPSQQTALGSIPLHLLEHLENRGHHNLLLTPQGVPLLFGRTPVLSITNNSRQGLSQTLAGFQPDIVHVFQPTALGIEAMRAARELGIPVLASYHSEFLELARLWGFSMPSELMWSTFRALHDLADLSLMPTYFSKMQLADLGFDRVGVWGRGVDCDLFSPKRRSSAWRRHLSDGEVKKTLLIYAGALTSQKHIELLKPVIEANSDCRLAIVGAGPESGWLKDYFEGTATVFTGYLDQGDLAEAYASADLFVHPASTDISSVTTLEAMASGLPVLAPHSGAILDFAVHGENALLCIPGDTQQASAYVAEISAKPGLRTDLGRIARQTALAKSWPITLDKLLRTYERMLDVHDQAHRLPIGSFRALPLPQVHA